MKRSILYSGVKFHKAPTTKHCCPICQWVAGPQNVWLCSKCGCVWNTFKTQGICPRCNYQWTETACLSCGGWSAHKDWYQNSKDR